MLSYYRFLGFFRLTIPLYSFFSVVYVYPWYLEVIFRRLTYPLYQIVVLAFNHSVVLNFLDFLFFVVF
jgi:hypothetical protein